MTPERGSDCMKFEAEEELKLENEVESESILANYKMGT